MQKNTDIPSLVRPLSPAAHYQPLRESLAAQVQDTRRNLLGYLDAGRLSAFSAVDEDSETRNLMDVASKANSAEDNVGDECIKIFLRIRPFKDVELEGKEDKKCFEVVSSNAVLAHAPPESATYKNHALLYGPEEREHRFTFSCVFPCNSDQKKIFDDTTQERVKNLVCGHDALIFSYGVTNGGKTYTFQGTDVEPGLIPRSLDLLFQLIREKMVKSPDVMPRMFNDYEILDAKKRQELTDIKSSLWKFLDTSEFEAVASNISVATYFTTTANSMGSSQSSFQSADDCSIRLQDLSSNASATSDYRCSVWVSFCEIYNEKVYDLLVPVTGVVKAKDRPTLRVSEDRRGNVYIKGARELFVTSVDEALKLLLVGRRNLQIAATNLNYNSSRSHCVYVVRLLKECIRPDGLAAHQISRLSFCDLAGSERAKKIDASGAGGGERIKETGSINASLLTLGRCMTFLRWNQTHRDRPQIIPYRDSKLTRLFQHYLSGQADACMVVNINQCASCFDETLHVLKFSAVAKEVKNIRIPVAAAGVIASAAVAAPPPKFSLLLNQFRDRERTVGSSNTDQSSDNATTRKQSLTAPLPADEEGGEADILDRTLDENNEVIQQYISIINDLKGKLIAEKQKNYLLELEIREEVCNEYGKLYREMEQHYNQDKEEAVADAEELAEERLELFVKSVNQRRKTMGKITMTDPENEEDDDAWVPAADLQAKEKECDDLRREVERLKDETNSGSASNFCPQVASSSIDKEDVEFLKRELEKKDKEIADIKEMLAEAAAMFEEQKSKIEKLEQENGQLQTAQSGNVDDSDGPVVVELNKKVKTLENENRELRERYEGVMCSTKSVAPKSEDTSTTDTKSMDVDGATSGVSLESDEGFKLIELESKIFDLERSLDAATKRAEALQLQHDKNLEKQEELSQQLTVAESKLQQRASSDDKLTQLETQLKEFQSKVANLEADNAKLVEESRDVESSSESLKKEVKDQKSRMKDLETELTASKEKLDASVAQKEAVEGTLRQNLGLLIGVQNRLKESERAVADAKKDRDCQLEEHERHVKESSAKISTANEEITALKEQIRVVDERAKSGEQKLAQLNGQVAALKADVERLTGEKKDALERCEEEKTKWEEEKKLLSEKSSHLAEIEAEHDRLKSLMKEMQDKLDQEHRNSLEEGNRWRVELAEAKTSLVNVKKERLDLLENRKRSDDECKRLSKLVQAMEDEIKAQKERNATLVADAAKSELAIQSYKTAESVLTKKNQELEQCHKDIQDLREKHDALEKNFILEQKKSMRHKTELDLKIELESKLKNDLNAVQGKLSEACHERNALQKLKSELETRLQSDAALQLEVSDLKSTNDALRTANETLKKESQGKDGRLQEAEQRAVAMKKQISDFQQRLQTKERQIEESTRANEDLRKSSEQWEVRFRNSEDERSSLAENVRQLKAENEKLGNVRTVVGGRKKTAKATTSDADNADEVELTVLASKPQKASPKKKTLMEATAKEEAPSDSETEPSSRSRPRGKGSRARKTSDDEVADTTSLASGKSAAAKPPTKSTARKPRTAKDTEEASAMFLRLNAEPDVLISNTGRPQRRAAQVASDGITAVKEYYRTGSSNVATTNETDALPGTSGDGDSSAELPTKRRRKLLKDPTAVFCSPVPEESPVPANPAGYVTLLKKMNVKAKK